MEWSLDWDLKELGSDFEFCENNLTFLVFFFLIWKNDSIASDYKDPYSSKIMWVNMKDVLNFSLLWLFKSTFGHRLNLTDYPLKGY